MIYEFWLIWLGTFQISLKQWHLIKYNFHGNQQKEFQERFYLIEQKSWKS